MHSERAVRIWLFAGLVMVFFQILLGGVTRLTGSGLSITRWEIVTGTLPPMNAEQWEEEFALYKETPQYQKINRGMELREFKFIYFWEYVHRLWARLMGLVFLFPFLYFLARGMIGPNLLRRLLIVVLIAAVVASFGWIMVASGLVNRPWVNAYKLTLHLNLGILLFGYLLWTWLHEKIGSTGKTYNWRGFLQLIFIAMCLQLLLGGLMSGMKACLYFPTWPEMHGSFIPEVLGSANWRWEHLFDYDSHSFAPALVQFLHRMLAYLLVIMGIVFGVRIGRTIVSRRIGIGTIWFISLLLIQAILGVLTVVNCAGRIPLLLGVLHQAGAVLLLATLVYLLYLSKERKAVLNDI